MSIHLNEVAAEIIKKYMGTLKSTKLHFLFPRTRYDFIVYYEPLRCFEAY